MTLLVTGASGFVGGHLIGALRSELAPSVRIVAAGGERGSAKPGARAESGVDYAYLDLVDAAAVDALIRDVRPTRVIHLAARSSVQQSHDAAKATFEVNVGGTSKLAEALRRHADGAVVIFASTGEIYGRAFASGEPLGEASPVLPMNPYSRSKLAAEFALADALSDACPVIALRLLNHTGAGQDERFVVPSFAAQIARIEAGLAEPRVLVGNLSAERDFLDIADVVQAYIRALRLADDAKGFKVFNVASGVPRSIASILDGLKALATTDFAVEADPARLRPSDIPRAVCDASAFTAATGWKPQRPWPETLAAVLEHWRSHCRQRA